MEFSCPKKPNNTFSNFLTSKNLLKLFYAFDKTLLGETGCLSSIYDLLATQASSFLIHFFCDLRDTPCHARGHYSHLSQPL